MRADGRSAKGRTFENDTVTFLKTWFSKAERRAKRGKRDAGDIAGTPFTIQCKRHETLRINEWMAELRIQQEYNDGDPPILVTKQSRRPRVWHLTDETMTYLLNAIYGAKEEAS